MLLVWRYNEDAFNCIITVSIYAFYYFENLELQIIIADFDLSTTKSKYFWSAKMLRNCKSYFFPYASRSKELISFQSIQSIMNNVSATRSRSD